MAIPYVDPPSLAQLAAHRESIARCRGRACFLAASGAFDGATSHQLEELIDGYVPKTDEANRKIWSGKYRKWNSGAIPSDETVRRASERGIPDLGYWRDLPLWRLLEEPTSLTTGDLHVILVSSSPPVRKIVFFDSRVSTMGRYVRHDLSRHELSRLRDLGTLEALTACLALAREAEMTNNDQRHCLAVQYAFAMFGMVLHVQPNLRQQWQALYDCMAMAFWSRQYLDGISPRFYKSEVARHLEALRTNPSARCEIGAKQHSPLTDGERDEINRDILLGLRHWRHVLPGSS